MVNFLEMGVLLFCWRLISSCILFRFLHNLWKLLKITNLNYSFVSFWHCYDWLLGKLMIISSLMMLITVLINWSDKTTWDIANDARNAQSRWCQWKNVIHHYVAPSPVVKVSSSGVPGPHKIVTLYSWAPNLLSSPGNVHLWLLEILSKVLHTETVYATNMISPRLITHRCVLKFICLLFYQANQSWNSHLFILRSQSAVIKFRCP